MPEKSKYYNLVIRIDEETRKLLEKLKEETGMSKREILGYSSQPCGTCGEGPVNVFTKNHKTMPIPRGILFTSLLTKHSGYQKNK
jgi:hypothetical protein